MWDTERTALPVKGPAVGTDPSYFKTHEAYYAAHEGELIINGSKYVELSEEGVGVAVYWSRKKHASYLSYEDVKKNLFVEFNEPENRAYPAKYSLRNAGTIDDPLFPWIKYQDDWGPG
jgi:hypothetical protein